MDDNNGIRPNMNNFSTVSSSYNKNNKMMGSNQSSTVVSTYGNQPASTVQTTSSVGQHQMGMGQYGNSPYPNNSMMGRGTPPIPNQPTLSPLPSWPGSKPPPLSLPSRSMPPQRYIHPSSTNNQLSDLPQKISKKDPIIFEAPDEEPNR